MKSRSLLAQVLAVNLLLVAGRGARRHGCCRPAPRGAHPQPRSARLVLAIVATLLGNWLLLRRRFAPLDRMISAMETVDLAAPHEAAIETLSESVEEKRLNAAFQRMIARLETERREAGRAAIRAQERERRRIAQDLHDEVNQALTAVSMRLQASIEHAPPGLRGELTETKRLSAQAMEELLALAHRLRPSVLDDHGLLPALRSQIRDFSDQTGIRASLKARGMMPQLTPEQQLVIYRVTQESLSNVAQHAGAHQVEVELSFIGRTILRVSDDGRGFVDSRNGGLGLSGMRERALLAGGQLAIWSGPEPGNASGAHDQGMTMHILVADDHGIVRAGIKLLLERQPDLDVVAEAADGVEATEQALATPAGSVHPRRRNAAPDGAPGGARDSLPAARRPGPHALHA
jgi:two-component system sensor histidine kinase UhpB